MTATRASLALLVALAAIVNVAVVDAALFSSASCGVTSTTTATDTCATLSTKFELTAEALGALNPGLDCASLPPVGTPVCIGDLLAYCSTTVDVPAGADCDDVAAANGLTTAGLLAHNPYINPAQCGSLPASTLCTAEPASELGGLKVISTAGSSLSSVAALYNTGLPVLQALNPTLPQTGALPTGTPVYVGCPPSKPGQTTCGVTVSQDLSNVLNLVMDICSVFQSCANPASLDGTTLLMELAPGKPIRVTPASAAGNAGISIPAVPTSALVVPDLGSLLATTLGGQSTGNAGLLGGLGGLLGGILGRKLMAVKQPIAATAETVPGRRLLGGRYIGGRWYPTSYVKPPACGGYCY
mmetsp:Transcript_14074/g.42474  ORF Transcript_14074/g.42474 Transcript_14074/m.42474 type:complete len:356 (+) Transcript_14074:189-1256(+)|eukprot:CAMPEP_0206135032 /NCGR_PEP_ID=MMETSP1473-20131121/398_1 /ASSEMBLY_ACC=CAM_ASM_001109 /TAXON_ID=1461547 /ORGANISM="Stichococcus sp, Strain RCC1054" /LENGTH=355 /DNA_ID=CAMNT_0053526731 /DNA_START=184 /DNA_END=1251 /DNA_ORIENTATION=+